MYSGLNNKLSNVPTITGLSNVVADQVVTDTLIVDGNDVGTIIIQVPINTANIATLQQITTGQTYASVGDTTTFDNNVTLGAGKTMTATNFTAGTNVTTPNILSLTSITPADSRSILFNGTRISNGGNANCIYMGPNAGLTTGTVGNNSVALGTNALSNATGVQNFAIGPAALNLCTTGNRNTAIGAGAARNLDTGFRNMCIGGASYGFPDLLISSFKCTTLGYDAYLSVDGTAFTTVIGAEVSCGSSNTVQIGRAADNTIFDGTVTMKNTASITTNGISPTSTLRIADSGTTNAINFLPNAGGGSFNFLTEAGDSLIMSGNTALDVADLTIAPYSSTLSGIRITPSTTFIGVGGASTTRTAGVTCSGTNVGITGTLTLNNNLILTTPSTSLTQTELSYLTGVTSNIQSQINAISPANLVTTNTVQNITANKTMFNADLLIDDGTGNNTSLSQDNQIIKIKNNNTNGIITITGLVAATSLDRIIPTDGSNPTTAQILNRTITGTNIPNQTSAYFVSAHTFNSLQQITTLSLPSGQIQGVGSLIVGMFITSGLGTNFSNGTYVTGLVSGTTYTINQPALNTTLFKVGVNFSLITASLTLPASVANGTIRFGQFAEFQFLTNNSGTTTMPLNLNSARMNVNVPTTITGNATVTGTTNLGETFLNGTNVHTGISWLNGSSTFISTNTTGTVTAMRLVATATQTFIQAGLPSTSGSAADIIFSSMYAASFWATMNAAGLTMNGSCMYGRDDQFAFLTIPAGGLNQPIGFTLEYIETAVTFTNNTQFVYTNLPLLDNGVWTVSVFLTLTRGTGTFDNNSTMRLSVVNSGTTNYYPDSCTSQMPLPSGHTVTTYTICMTYTYIVKSTVQERTSPAGIITMAALGTATKRLRAVLTKIA